MKKQKKKIENKTKKALPKALKITFGLLLCLVVFCGIGIGIYYLIKAITFRWFIFVALIPIIPFGIANLKRIVFRKGKHTVEQNKQANVKVCIYTLFYWLCDLFYMSFLIDNITCKFIFGGLIMLIIFMNLVKAFTYPNERRTGFESWGLLQDFLVGVGLSIYLIYIIPCDDVKEVVIPVIAAVYGGLITLVGVAWTIHKNEKDKKAEEIEKAKPYLQLISDNHIPDKDQKFDAKVTISFSGNYKDEQVVLNRVLPHCLHIKNVGGLLIIEAIKLDSTYKSCKKTLVAENNNLLLCLQSFSFNVERETVELILYGHDKLNNYYSFTIENKIKKHENVFNWKLEYIGMPIKVEEQEIKEIYKELEKEESDNA